MKIICQTLTLLICFFVSSILADDQPNILWLTCEDIGRHLGCYESPTAVTPVLDRLAERGMLYRFAWSNHPVCAPARTTIITGCYPASLGAEQMRSSVPLPNQIEMFPRYLRQNGYYCANNFKEDYNVFAQDGKNCWDVSNNKAHWKNRPPNTPFFAVFNFETTHESQIRNKHELQRDLEKESVPKYHPNVPEIRRDWAQYHDRIAEMDIRCGVKLDELEKAGLEENTIVFFFGDHGSGMPRNKRTPFDCGLGVPFIVYFPLKFKHLAPPDYRNGTKSERLISFVDLAPTMLSLAGIEPPKTMQGIAFAGKFIGKPREFVFGFRGRMDERGDLVRSVSDGRYVYVRNYHPEIIYGARNNYMFQTRTTQVWRELYDQGNLPAEQAFFWKLKPTEELYDLKTDHDEIVNLADLPEYCNIKTKLKSVLYEHLSTIRDVHFLPEAMLHMRFAGSTPYEMGHKKQYPFEKILNAADRATDRSVTESELRELLSDTEPAVRYWGAIGILVRLADTAGVDGTQPNETTTTLLDSWKPIL
ncbi:MAG: sulfatase, partial [Planctomycetaceae bacterium]|nr:sulfatase [Planctomycetaceae bacterium]